MGAHVIPMANIPMLHSAPSTKHGPARALFRLVPNTSNQAEEVTHTDAEAQPTKLKATSLPCPAAPRSVKRGTQQLLGSV